MITFYFIFYSGELIVSNQTKNEGAKEPAKKESREEPRETSESASNSNSSNSNNSNNSSNENTSTNTSDSNNIFLKELDEAKQKAEDNWNLFLRTRADMDNIRRRAQLDLESSRKYSVEKFARELLGVVDSLEHGLSVAEKAGDVAYKEGMALTIKLLLDTFDKFDIKRIYPLSETFDPSKHEAISMLENAEVAPNTILVVAQPGFILHDRVLRPARVVVAKASEATSKQSQSEGES